jgi:hypothetical protein
VIQYFTTAFTKKNRFETSKQEKHCLENPVETKTLRFCAFFRNKNVQRKILAIFATASAKIENC